MATVLSVFSTDACQETFLCVGNLEQINVSPNHPYLTSKDGVLCLQDEYYDVIVFYPPKKNTEIILDSNDIVSPWAFNGSCGLQKFTITDEFCDAIHSFAEYPDLSKYWIQAMMAGEESTKDLYSYFDALLYPVAAPEFFVSDSNKYFSTDENGILYNKDKSELIKYPINSGLEFLELHENVIPSAYAFLSKSVLDLYYPDNLTVHIQNLERQVIPAKIVCINTDKNAVIADGEETYTVEEYVNTYNADLEQSELQAKAEIDAFEKEYSGEMDKSRYKSYLTYIMIDSGIYMPNIEFCEGHEVEPDVPGDNEEPTTQPEEPTTQPEVPTTQPEEPTTKPEEPTTKPASPAPDEPTADKEIIPSPTRSEISYGDAIVLHVDKTKIPEGGYVVWSADNDNFSYTVADDGTCTITPESSGDTTFTATIYDAEGNAVSTDEQTMTSKVGFFQKLIAFFKKLFNLTKVYPNFIAD